MLNNARKTLGYSRLSLFLIIVAGVIFTPTIYSQEVNVALGKPATQSSNMGGGFGPTEGLAALAVDGNKNGDWKGRSVSHTAVAGSVNPWWSVDLGAVYNVNKIEIWNRTDCCQERLSNFRIMVIGTSGNGWEEFTPGLKTYTDYPLTITGSKRTRGVMVQIMGPNATLMLAEVKVFGTPAGPVAISTPTSPTPPSTPTIYSQEVNLALGKPAEQSSLYAPPGVASKAVDGNTGGDGNLLETTHTALGDANPWWRVDLGAEYNINKIQIWNRTDCCRERLSNYRMWTRTVAGGWEEFAPGLKTYQPGETYPLTFTGSKKARFVMVQITDNPKAILSLAEVKVFGTPVGPIL